MPHLDAYDVISVVGIPVYAVFLLCAVYLCAKHGFSKSSGWRFLIVLALARIIGFGMRLGLVNDPTNTSLWIGWMTVTSLGLGPLVLVLLSLLSRVFESVHRQGQVVLKPIHQRLIQTLVLAAIVVTVVGGTQSSFRLDNGSVAVDYGTAARVGVGLMAAAVASLVLETFVACLNRRFVAQGEHRILLGVAASLPFVAVRLVYPCLVVLAGTSADVWMYLCMCVLMELAVVFMLTVLGFTLDKLTDAPKTDPEQAASQEQQQGHS
ncbi:uncharacterized protein UV8b_06525 [Ustilaginoidea virens]|uniref:DUF7702 domain-containing protein n=1 Tax=Ustilaginoidea virens TaxID=1159556 RepID=A0A063C9D6_USTVR|nr:uncharacterized protein UV8b_06525 [Ustilaginoidea virens]QUC22284.1 hypothetical protein UV8b_06525 [Ustilaginoidea virens]GAO14127.1 hypothetical protein UVI_02037850 [Ustilaginoidea virens]